MAYVFHWLLLYACYVFVYSCIPRYKLLSPYTVTCMNVFGTDLLTSDNPLLCSSLGSIPSFTPGFTQLPVVFCVGLRTHGLSSIWLGINFQNFGFWLVSFASLSSISHANSTYGFSTFSPVMYDSWEYTTNVTLWNKSGNRSVFDSLLSCSLVSFSFPIQLL